MIKIKPVEKMLSGSPKDLSKRFLALCQSFRKTDFIASNILHGTFVIKVVGAKDVTKLACSVFAEHLE